MFVPHTKNSVPNLIRPLINQHNFTVMMSSELILILLREITYECSHEYLLLISSSGVNSVQQNDPHAFSHCTGTGPAKGPNGKYGVMWCHTGLRKGQEPGHY